MTLGLLSRSGKVVPYGGVSAAVGSFINWGYLTAKAEYGKFFTEEEENSHSIRLEGTYFTNLHDWKFTKVRHFFSPTFAWGSQRYNFNYKDRMTISSQEEFPAYSEDFIGTKKLILRHQMQLFVNKTWKNFHFSPYSIVTLGWIAQNNESIFKAKTNSKFGVGVLINNPYLVFNKIQLSFVYYPNTPFDSKAVYEFNDYRNSQLPFNTFETDIPHFVNFQN